MKDIVIVANFSGNLMGTDNNRFAYLAQMLCENNTVELITSNFEHKSKAKRTSVSKEYRFKITLIEEPPYPRNVCVERFVSHAVFGRNVAKYLAKRKKPDVIYCAVPSLDVAWKTAKFARENKVKFIIDIQDLWPEAFKMVLNIPIISDLIFLPMTYRANKIYACADEIIAVSETYCKRAMKVNNKCKEAHTVFLGTRISDFDFYAKEDSVTNFAKEKLKLAYCGTLGSSYDLTCVIDALDILNRNGVQTPQFIVMGDGPRKEEFERYAEKMGVDAVFMGRLEYAEMCAVLCKCDMTVNPITKGAAQSIINKHADYAASGLAVLNTQECEEYRNLVEKYDMGFNCINNNAYDLAMKIEMFINDKEKRLNMGKNARRCALERFDREYSYKEIIDLIIR